MELSAGEYGYTLRGFARLIAEGAADVLQADATRCGLSGFMAVSALCECHGLPLSSHCAPMQHLHACAASPALRHMEFFHDHVRIERMFFDGFVEPVDGAMAPDLSRPGAGLELKAGDAEPFLIGRWTS
jgi:L-alanine-DL-glutamate epimerase-like enolase superfamily enzyme